MRSETCKGADGAPRFPLTGASSARTGTVEGSRAAMAEYVILLTLTTGRSWLGRLTETLTAEPLVTGAVVIALVAFGYVLIRR